jgi:Holliday junction resolvasome RuvABC endonuclease subunit
MYVVGLDLSLRSPGFAVYDRITEHWDLHGFVQNKKMPVGTRYTDNCTVHLLPPIPKNCADTDVYTYILRHLTIQILDRLKDQDVLFILEGYAFSKHNNGTYKLHELGGVVKTALSQMKFRQKVYPPTYWKKLITGKGNCSKQDVFNHISQSLNSGPNLQALFGLDLSKVANVPHPIEDMSDAVGLVLASLVESKTTSMKNVSGVKRKRN